MSDRLGAITNALYQMVGYRRQDRAGNVTEEVWNMGKKRRGCFEWWKGAREERYYFHLKAPNGKIIAQSEGYNSRQAMLNGIDAVKRCGPDAPVIEITNN